MVKKIKKAHAAKKRETLPETRKHAHRAPVKHEAQPAVKESAPQVPPAGRGCWLAAVAILVMLAALILWKCFAEPQTQLKNTPGIQASIMPTDFLSDVNCAGSNIEGRITNMLGKKLEMANVRVLLDGRQVDTALLKCDKDVLSPGESTICASLNGISPIAGDNEIAVVLDESKSDKENITC